MAEQSKELAYVPAKEKAMQVFTTEGALDPYLAHVRAEIDAFKPDLTTKKGRDAIASMAYKVSQSKSALETLGKALADEAKDIPKKIDASRKKMKETLDAWRDEVRKPLDDWQAEQDRLAAEEEARRTHEALLIKIESDHEIAILLDEKFDRERAEKLAEQEKARIEYEAKIAAEAAENARIAAEEAAANAIKDAQLEKERAENEKLLAEARERQAKIDSDARELKLKEDAEKATKLAAENAEQQRLQVIAETEARIAREKAAEDAAAAKLAANKANQKRKNNDVLAFLMAHHNMTEEAAKALIKDIALSNIPWLTINY